jgi:hypothetical protein
MSGNETVDIDQFLLQPPIVASAFVVFLGGLSDSIASSPALHSSVSKPVFNRRLPGMLFMPGKPNVVILEAVCPLLTEALHVVTLTGTLTALPAKNNEEKTCFGVEVTRDLELSPL